MELYRLQQAEKIHVVYEGVDARFAARGRGGRGPRAAARYSPDRPYLLMVGTLEPRKNHATRRCTPWPGSRQQGHPHRLLIVGGHGMCFLCLSDSIHHCRAVHCVLFHTAGSRNWPLLHGGASWAALDAQYNRRNLVARMLRGDQPLK